MNQMEMMKMMKMRTVQPLKHNWTASRVLAPFQSQDLPGKLAGVVVQVLILEIVSQKITNFDTRRCRASCMQIVSPIIISNQRQYYLPACD